MQFKVIFTTLSSLFVVATAGGVGYDAGCPKDHSLQMCCAELDGTSGRNCHIVAESEKFVCDPYDKDGQTTALCCAAATKSLPPIGINCVKHCTD